MDNLNSASRARTSTTTASAAAAASSVENDLNLLNKMNMSHSKKTDVGASTNESTPTTTANRDGGGDTNPGAEEANNETASVSSLSAEQQAEYDKEADAIRRRRLEHFQTSLNNQ